MSNDAIEPSEIFTREHPRSQLTRRMEVGYRFLARFFDYSIWLILLGLLRLWVGHKFPTELSEYLIPFEFFTWIPVEAALLSTWGTTPGKFVFKIHLQQGRKKKLDFATALRRSAIVWFRGFGMGIMVVNVLCMMMAAHRLQLHGKTSWDREENINVHYKYIKRPKIIASCCFIALSFAFYYLYL